METRTHFRAQLEAVYNGEPWYGKPVCQLLKGIEPDLAFRRLNPHVHTIAELLAHMISWKQVLINHLKKNGKPKPRQRESFLTEAYGPTPELAWPALKQRFESQHHTLTGLLGSDDPGPGERRAAGRFPLKLAEGVVQHDIYHIAQIALLKKALQI